jgi:exodeoxyribonuclease-3
MRVVTYNLFEGAQVTLPLVQDFAEQQAVDVLCVQEANGWNDGEPSKLEQLAADTGLSSYVFGNSNTRFKLATLSRLPIVGSQVHTDGFWHSAIQTTVPFGDGSLDLWNVHLNPGDEDSRLAEAKLLAEMIDTDKPAIIMGDFNSLSGTDEHPDQLIADLAVKGIKKFGTDRLRYDVTEYLTAQGFVDVAAAFGARQTTVPTPANKDMYHAASMRLDYMFATASIMPSVTGVAVPKNELTDVISDHYPIVLTLQG